jgi:hypothetical protein
MGPGHSWGGGSLWGAAALVAMVAAIGGFASVQAVGPGAAYAPGGQGAPVSHATGAPVAQAPVPATPSVDHAIPVVADPLVSPASALTPIAGTVHSSVPAAPQPSPALPPALSLLSPSGTVGSSDTVNGTNFLGGSTYIANIAVATWSPGGAILCSGAINLTTGNFSCSFTVPEATGGAHLINVTAPGAQTANITFTVNASLAASPASDPAVANQSATLTAMGLGGNVSATFTWSPGFLSVCSANSSALGTASCTFDVPTATSYSAMGPHLIKANDSFGHIAYTNFTIVPTLSVQYTSPSSLYMPLNLSLAWTISTDAAINTNSTTMWLLVEDLGSAACPYVSATGTVVNPPCPVLDLPLSYLITNGTSSYSFVLNETTMVSQFYNKGVLPYATEYSVAVFVSIATGPYVAGIATGAAATSAATIQVYLRTYQVSAVLLSPSTSLGNPTGNISVTVSYQGDFITGATVAIVSQKTGDLVYAASVAVAGVGPHVGTGGTDWHPTIAGAYTVTVNLTGPENTTLINFLVNVVPAGTTVYVNSTSYTNQSLIHGLGAAATGSLLLVVGTLIGLVVAFLIGRLVWSKPAGTPPTPWTGEGPGKEGPGKDKDKPGAKGANECMVCHQSFATEAELKDHQAKVHGSSS